MPFKSYRDESRNTNWGTEGEGMDLNQINAGSLLRIADATEAMAREHNRLIQREKYLEGVCRSRSAEIECLKRRNAALKGVITKMKKEARDG